MSKIPIHREPFNHLSLIMQNKPNFRKAQMSANVFLRKDYENETTLRPQKNKPNQTQVYPVRDPLLETRGKKALTGDPKEKSLMGWSWNGL